MRAKNRGMARSHRYCINFRFCLVTASSMSPRKVVNSFLNEPLYGRYPT